MTTRRALILIVVILATSFVGLSPAYACWSEGGGYSVIIECRKVHHNPGGPLDPLDPPSPADGVTYSYVWLPNCPGALPSDENVGELDCPAAHNCADPQLMSMSLYAMQLTNRAGQLIQSGWVYLGSECRDPQDAGPTEQPRVLAWSDVLSAIRQVGVPGASVEAPDYTLVNLETT